MPSSVVEVISDTTSIIRTGRTRIAPRFSIFRGVFIEYQEERMQEHKLHSRYLGKYVMHSPPFWVKSDKDFSFKELIGIGRDVV